MPASCSRCGRDGEMEYGADGQPYCSGCIFYGMNKQCYRCRMYLPANELQQYQGQWVCPYCVQDMRADDARRDAATSGAAPARPRMNALILSEQCERCGRDLESRVYVWNGRKLCRSCLKDEQDKWGFAGGGPMGPPQRIRVESARPAKQKSIVEGLISEALAIAGMRPKPQVREIILYPTLHAEVAGAKPMAEKSINAPIRKTLEEAKRPQPEGIMKGAEDKRAEVKVEPAEKSGGKRGGKKEAQGGKGKRKKKESEEPEQEKQ